MTRVYMITGGVVLGLALVSNLAVVGMVMGDHDGDGWHHEDRGHWDRSITAPYNRDDRRHDRKRGDEERGEDWDDRRGAWSDGFSTD